METVSEIGSASSAELAKHRYGREELLALYARDLQIPDDLKDMSILCIRQQQPMALLPVTEDEQSSFLQCVNSAPCLKSVQYPVNMGRVGKSSAAGCQGKFRGIGRGKSYSDSSFGGATLPETSGLPHTQEKPKATYVGGRAETVASMSSADRSKEAKGSCPPAKALSKNLSSCSNSADVDDLEGGAEFHDCGRKLSNEENLDNSSIRRKASDNCLRGFSAANDCLSSNLSSPRFCTDVRLSCRLPKSSSLLFQPSLDQSSNSIQRIHIPNGTDISADKNLPDGRVISSLAAQKSWYYKDPNGLIQGPFSGKDMEEWFVAGYFTTKLFVRQGPNGDFATLGDMIKNLGCVPFFAESSDLSLSSNSGGLLPVLAANSSDQSASDFGFQPSSSSWPLMNLSTGQFSAPLTLPPAASLTANMAKPFSYPSSFVGSNDHPSLLPDLSVPPPFFNPLDPSHPSVFKQPYSDLIQPLMASNSSYGSAKSVSDRGVDSSESLISSDLINQVGERNLLTRIESELKEKILNHVKEKMELEHERERLSNEQLKIAEERRVMKEHQRLLETEKRMQEERWKMEEERRRLLEERRRVEELHRRAEDERQAQEQLSLERRKNEEEKQRMERERMQLEEERCRLMELHREAEEERHRLLLERHLVMERHPPDNKTTEDEKGLIDEKEREWKTVWEKTNGCESAPSVQSSDEVNSMLDDFSELEVEDSNPRVVASDPEIVAGGDAKTVSDECSREKSAEQNLGGSRNHSGREVKLVAWKACAKDELLRHFAVESKEEHDKCPWAETEVKGQSVCADDPNRKTDAEGERGASAEEERLRQLFQWTNRRSSGDVSKKVPSLVEIQQEQEVQQKQEEERLKRLEMERQRKKQLEKKVPDNPWRLPGSSARPKQQNSSSNVSASDGGVHSAGGNIPSLLSLRLPLPESPVQNFFQRYASEKSELMFWCRNHLMMNSVAVDMSTLIDFLFDVDSPYELHSYVRQYLGQSASSIEFTRRVIECKNRLKISETSSSSLPLPSNCYSRLPNFGAAAETNPFFNARPYGNSHAPMDSQLKCGKKKGAKLAS